MPFKIAAFHPSIFVKKESPPNSLCIRLQFDQESTRTLWLLDRYEIENVIVAPELPDVSYWVEAPDIACGIPVMWMGGRSEEEMIPAFLSHRHLIRPADIMYIDTSPRRIKLAKDLGVATFARPNPHNPLAEKPSWPITSTHDVALIASAQYSAY